MLHKPLDSCPHRTIYRFIEDKEKFSCPLSGSSPSFAATHDLSDEASHAVATLVRGRTLWLVGDSMSSQYHTAVVCTLWRMDFSCRTGLSQFNPHVVCTAVETSKRRSFGRVCSYVADYAKRSKTDPVVELQKMVGRKGLARPGDSVILNLGLYFTRDADHFEGFRRSRVWLRTIAHVRNLSTHVLPNIYWRETTPQHFNTSSGNPLPLPHLPSDDPRCVPALPSDATNVLNERVNDLAHGFGVPVLPAWQRGRNRGDAKVGRATSWAQKTGLDCTHWCEPSGYLATLVSEHASAIAAHEARGRGG